MPAALVAFVATADGRAAIVGDDLRLVGPLDRVVPRAADLEASGDVRWVWWSAGQDAAALVAAG
jgi:DNA polymerase-1